MDVKKEFNLIKTIKNSKSIRYQKLMHNFLLKKIQYFETIMPSYSFDQIVNIKHKISGVYLIYSIVNNELIFCYIGESKNIFKRFIQHKNNILYKNCKNKLYSRIISRMGSYLSFIRFLIICKVNDQNQRLIKESYFIHVFKSKFYLLNKRNSDLKLKCPYCNKNKVKTILDYERNKTYLKLVVKAKCRNSECNNTFYIK